MAPDDRRLQARNLRAGGATLAEIAAEVGVSRSTASVWVRGVEAPPRARSPRAGPREPHPFHVARLAEIERLRSDGVARIGQLSTRDLLVAGTALYAGEGAKTDGVVKFANTDPRMIQLFLGWLREFFDIEESRLRVRLYLHAGLDLDFAVREWARLTGIPAEQFTKPYRAVPDPSIRTSKHPLGCPAVAYSCATTHRAIMGLVGALLSSPSHLPG